MTTFLNQDSAPEASSYGADFTGINSAETNKIFPHLNAGCQNQLSSFEVDIEQFSQDLLDSAMSQPFGTNYSKEVERWGSALTSQAEARNDNFQYDATEEGGFYDNKNLLRNDIDPDNLGLTVASVNGQTIGDGKWIALEKGDVFVNKNGEIDFAANGDFDDLANGETREISFQYKLSDSESEVDTAQATITVNGVGGRLKEQGKAMRFVYFVEADQSFDQNDYNAIKDFATDLQQHWYDEFGGTFNLTENVVDVIYGDANAAWYANTPDNIHTDPRWYRLGNVKNEVYSKLGISEFDPNVRVVNFPEARFDGKVGGNFGGAWMDGDDLEALDGQTKTYPYAGGTAATALGHVSHELGHVFGLDHEGPDNSVMQFGFYEGANYNPSFTRENAEKVRSLPQNQGWLDAQPGDRVKTIG